VHLRRQACTHHLDEMSSIEAMLGTKARWCQPAEPAWEPVGQAVSKCRRQETDKSEPPAAQNE
jgi:hypothetical protein